MTEKAISDSTGVDPPAQVAQTQVRVNGRLVAQVGAIIVSITIAVAASYTATMRQVTRLEERTSVNQSEIDRARESRMEIKELLQGMDARLRNMEQSISYIRAKLERE